MKNIKAVDIKRDWRLIDATNKVLGRLSTDIAQILMGKNKAYYTPHLDCGDYVVITNASKIVLSGKKEKQKIYYHYSGFPGGLKLQTAAILRSKKPEELITHSTRGMLPKTKLGKLMIKKLFVYPGSDHPHTDKFRK